MLLAACAGYRDHIAALEGIHRQPAEAPIYLEPERQGFLEFSPTWDGDEVEDPVDFCLSEVEDVEDYGMGFDTARERFEPLFVLSFVGGKSPSALVRARALRAVRHVGAESAATFRMPRPGEGPAIVDASARLIGALKTARELMEDESGGAASAEKFQRTCAEALESFAASAEPFTEAIWNSLRAALTEPMLDEIEDPSLEERIEWAANRLDGRLAFLAAHTALVDPSETVRQEGIDLLFLFPWTSIEDSLAVMVERNPFLKSPTQMISVMRHIREKKDRPPNPNLKVMTYIVEGLSYQAHAGVVLNAVRALEEITGRKDPSPASWQKWWSEYLLKHAGD